MQVAFDAGLRSAQVEAAIATYDQSVATAFQQVEDQLAAVRILARQQKVADKAVKATQEELDILKAFSRGKAQGVHPQIAAGMPGGRR